MSLIDFTELSKRIVDNVLTKVVPVQGIPTHNYVAFDLYRLLYSTRPDCFHITGNLHANGERDMPHISVSVQISPKFVHKLHFYCYFKGQLLFCSHITIMHGSGLNKTVREVVRFL